MKKSIPLLLEFNLPGHNIMYKPFLKFVERQESQGYLSPETWNQNKDYVLPDDLPVIDKREILESEKGISLICQISNLSVNSKKAAKEYIDFWVSNGAKLGKIRGNRIVWNS